MLESFVWIPAYAGMKEMVWNCVVVGREIASLRSQ